MTTRITAHWLPILLEPMPGSGERFVIGVAAVDSHGKFHIGTAISEATARCMYGAAAPHVLGLVDVTLTSLRMHLEAGHQVNQWLPPLVSQTHTGQLQYAEGPDLQTIVRDGLSLASSLAWRLYQ